jgi:hypothetical protein
MRATAWFIALALCACSFRKEFPAATPADAAACRNVARDVTRDTWGRTFDEAWNDCMLSKGLKPSE